MRISRLMRFVALGVAVSVPLGSCDDGPTGPGEPEASRFSMLSVGHYYTCALSDLGEAYCWGRGEYGQLGDGGTNNKSVAVTGQVTFASLSAGAFHTCGLTEDGQAYCWGRGSYHRLGTGEMTHRLVPEPVGGEHTWSTISAGWLHSCAVDLEGAAWCWGSTNFGRLGIGPSQELYEPVPARVLGGHAFTWLEAGMVEKCGVALGGAAYCWGKGGDGQIGDGTTETRYLMTAGER